MDERYDAKREPPEMTKERGVEMGVKRKKGEGKKTNKMQPSRLYMQCTIPIYDTQMLPYLGTPVAKGSLFHFWSYHQCLLRHISTYCVMTTLFFSPWLTLLCQTISYLNILLLPLYKRRSTHIHDIINLRLLFHSL